MWRLYNPNSGEHFYTGDGAEMRNLASLGWYLEGVGWVAPLEGDPVYRLYNPNSGDHHYTLSSGERDLLEAEGWTYEGVGWMSGGGVQVLRQYNPNAKSGTHNFTTSAGEAAGLEASGWSGEGVAWQALSSTAQAVTPSWVDGPGGERMRVLADGSLATGRFEADGAAYWGKPGTGWIVRGAWLAPDGNIVRAGSDGTLREGSLTGSAELDAIVDDYIRANTGTGADALRRLYDSMSSFAYIDGDGDADWQSWCVPYALDFWHDGGGNCYRYAAFSYWMARGLGYDNAVIRVGKVVGRTALLNHSWLEVPNEEGVPCVIDPEAAFVDLHSSVDLYMVPYAETAIIYCNMDGEPL
ncbi:MAG: hypothetical protein Q4B54_06690 [Coriobacteriales bacterium]|nr:hypothetical protein [Coriobacteriales bacterium]